MGAMPVLVNAFFEERVELLFELAELIRMKLTSFRLRDQMHLKDLDEAGLITPDAEAGLSTFLAERLAQVRAHE